MKAPHLFQQWTIVTILAWTIAALIQTPTDSPIQWFAQWLTSPISIAIVGLIQTLTLWNHPKHRDRYFKTIAIQLIISLALQLLILCSSLVYALLSIAHLGKGGIWISFVEFNAIVCLTIGLISNIWVQGWGFRQLCCDRAQSRHPYCPLIQAIDRLA